jgi:hypothetical protein
VIIAPAAPRRAARRDRRDAALHDGRCLTGFAPERCYGIGCLRLFCPAEPYLCPFLSAADRDTAPTVSDQPLGDHRLTFAAQAWATFKKEFKTTPVQLSIAIVGLFATIYSITAPLIVFEEGGYRASNFTAKVNISQIDIILGLVAVEAYPVVPGSPI